MRGELRNPIPSPWECDSQPLVKVENLRYGLTTPGGPLLYLEERFVLGGL